MAVPDCGDTSFSTTAISEDKAKSVGLGKDGEGSEGH